MSIKVNKKLYNRMLTSLMIGILIGTVFTSFVITQRGISEENIVEIKDNVNENSEFRGGRSLANSPWPMFRHDARHTGLSPYNTSENNGQLIWSFKTGGYMFSSPAIGSDDTIYIGSNDGKLYSINSNGTENWNFDFQEQLRSSPAISSDGTIYIASYGDKLYAINTDGTLKWIFHTGNRETTSPAIGPDGTIYLGSHDQHLYAINPNGTQKWVYPGANGTPIDSIISSPAIGPDGTIFIGTGQGINRLYAINPDGTEKWCFNPGGVLSDSSPAIGSDGTIYIGSMEHKLYAINSNGTAKWNFTTGHIVQSSPAIGSDGTIYVGSNDNNLYAIRPNGTEKWNFTTGKPIYSSPAISADSTIYVGSWDSKIYAIHSNGTEKWNFKTGTAIHSSPSIGSDGTIYIGSSDYKLYAIGKNETSPVNRPPVADAGPDKNTSVNQTVYFDGSGSYDPDNDPIQYNWDFGDDTTTGWQNLSGVSHTYNQAGNYTVTLTVRDTIHPPFLMDNDTCIVKVTDPSSSNNPPVADAGSDQNANISQTVYFDGSGSYDPDNDPLTYNWDFGDGTSTNWQNNCNSSHAYNATGNYTVTLTVSDGVLNDDDICIVSVKSSWSGSTNNPPIADAGPDQTVKVGQIVNFDGSGSYDPDGDPLLYLWEFGDMPMPSWFNSSFRVHSYAQPGIYTATLSVSDGEFTDHDNCTIYVIDEDSGEKPDKVNDTDGDGLPDDWELEHGFDPNDSNDAELDPDGDTLTNLDEFEQGTDPHNKDTDGDDIPDNWELENGLNPTDGTDAVLDPDGDSLSNLREFQQSTNPQDKDTDGDGYPDNIDAYPTNPNKYKEEITDNKALIETYAIILILIIIIVIIIVMMAVLYKNKRKISGQISTDDRQEIRDSYMAEEFQPPESSDLESDGLIKNLKQEALVPDKPNVFGLTEQEILEKIDIKYRNGELSKTTYDSIRETIGTFKP